MELEPAFLSGRTLAVVVVVAGGIVLYLLGRLVLARIARPAYPMPERLADRARAARAMLLRFWAYAVAGGLVLALVALLPGVGGGAFLLAGAVGALALLAVGAVFRDLVAGFSILLEGQMGPGDRVRLFGVGVEGVVQEVRLRRTILCEDDGSQVIVPNASIAAVRTVSPDALDAASREDAGRERSDRDRRRGGRRSRRRGGRGRGRGGGSGSDRKQERSPRKESDSRRKEPDSRPKEPDQGDEPGGPEGSEAQEQPPREVLSESPWSIE